MIEDYTFLGNAKINLDKRGIKTNYKNYLFLPNFFALSGMQYSRNALNSKYSFPGNAHFDCVPTHAYPPAQLRSPRFG
jgi:hypothetical protein